MSSKILFSLCVLLFQFGFKSRKSVPNFSGNWHAETSSSSFDISLTQTNNKLSGSHCSVQMNGDKIDCVLEDSNVSLTGDIENPTYVIVTFTSQISKKEEQLKLQKISDSTIDWKILKKPQGEYHIPNRISLIKKRKYFTFCKELI